MTEPTPDQRRNRQRLFGALRTFAGLLAILITIDIARAMKDGYLKLGIGDTRGPTRDYILLDTPFGLHVGLLFLEVCAVFLLLLAFAPRYALRQRVWVPTLGAIVVVNIILGVFFR